MDDASGWTVEVVIFLSRDKLPLGINSGKEVVSFATASPDGNLRAKYQYGSLSACIHVNPPIREASADVFCDSPQAHELFLE